ncbi:MAG: class I SAM-dependent methyltransferase [Candidatus Scalindua sp.]|jgi:2-polyprenyl-3-methyl-5-hydroxy-6-metoxy-1,4-benzoquinol methylase|nr:class I SAM-dependent methyltransferase [Candidatus Scalindua sp.]
MGTKFRKTEQNEWYEQWSIFDNKDLFLFEDWIFPATIEDFRDKTVLECGCGGGDHTAIVGQVAKSVTAVDLNTIELARERNRKLDNVTFLKADIATMALSEQFDVVFCIGVIHHTDDPEKTFQSIYQHCKPGGKIIIWTYSAEGNELVRFIVEPIRKILLKNLSRKILLYISRAITIALYPVIYTVYITELFSFLPYFDYFRNFRKMTFKRNVSNVFDKLNAPQTHFITFEKCKAWFNEARFVQQSISIRKYVNVSWCLSGVKKQ